MGNAKRVRISGVSSCPGFEFSVSNYRESSTPKPRGIEIVVRVIGNSSYTGFELPWLYRSFVESRDF